MSICHMIYHVVVFFLKRYCPGALLKFFSNLDLLLSILPAQILSWGLPSQFPLLFCCVDSLSSCVWLLFCLLPFFGIFPQALRKCASVVNLYRRYMPENVLFYPLVLIYNLFGFKVDFYSTYFSLRILNELLPSSNF